MTRDVSKKLSAGGVGNELWLVHGSLETAPQAIWEDTGFDFRIGRSTSYYGRAAYFAESPVYRCVVLVVVPSPPLLDDRACRRGRMCRARVCGLLSTGVCVRVCVE